ncbi:hypothetical protein [Leptodesmis sp.]|uniref:hypothetical protein n=1 Tax=Leptodesmis sp. TaxID=3100501 RepID=UPI003D0A1437
MPGLAVVKLNLLGPPPLFKPLAQHLLYGGCRHSLKFASTLHPKANRDRSAAYARAG